MAYQCRKMNKECEGCGLCEPEPPTCPICGAECETVYKDYYGDIIGCNECVKRIYAWE